MVVGFAVAGMTATALLPTTLTVLHAVDGNILPSSNCKGNNADLVQAVAAAEAFRSRE